MILGLTREEKQEKLTKILSEVIDAIANRDLEVISFDVGLNTPFDGQTTFEISFEIGSDTTLVQNLRGPLWGKEE